MVEGMAMSVLDFIRKATLHERMKAQIAKMLNEVYEAVRAGCTVKLPVDGWRD